MRRTKHAKYTSSGSSFDETASSTFAELFKVTRLLPSNPTANDTAHSFEMNSDTTNTATSEQQEKHLEVSMSGDDYEVCTKLLRRLLEAELIHAYWWHEETSTTYIHYSARVNHEGLPNDDDKVRGVEGTKDVPLESGHS
jgi:hypothetical protein